MNNKYGKKKRLGLVVVAISMVSLLVGVSWADDEQGIEQLEHKEKSTLETFHLNEIDSDELSETVIAGGLEPTSAGGSSQPVTVYEDASALLPIDRETDLGRYEISTKVNYTEARQVPGVTYSDTYSITPSFDIGNRRYDRFDANVFER